MALSLSKVISEETTSLPTDSFTSLEWESSQLSKCLALPTQPQSAKNERLKPEKLPSWPLEKARETRTRLRTRSTHSELSRPGQLRLMLR